MSVTLASKQYETTSASPHRKERLLTIHIPDATYSSDSHVRKGQQVGITTSTRSNEPGAEHETGNTMQLLLPSDIQFVAICRLNARRPNTMLQSVLFPDSFAAANQTAESVVQMRRTTRDMLLPWNGQITLAKSCKEVVAVMEQANMDPQITERIAYLDGLSDDPDEPSINMESLQKFTAFIIMRRHLPCPRIGLTPEGLIEIAWDTSDGDMLSMYFLPVGDIRFAVILATSEDMPRQRSLGGLLPPDDMMNMIWPFVDKLIPA